MKRMIAYMAALLLAWSLTSPALCAYEPEDDYMSVMLDAVAAGDEEAGYNAQEDRDEKIAQLRLDYLPVSFEDLLLLSKIMVAEAGSCWLDDQWRLCVGEVVLNRVASPEFPDSIREVLEQTGQYYGKNSAYLNGLKPDRHCAELALRLLEGERRMEPSVVFQANFRQGSGTYLELQDKQLGSLYFCFSSHPELYSSPKSSY